MSVDVKCPACHTLGYTVLTPVRRDEYRYLMCSACGLGRIDPMPGAGEPYDRGYFVDGGGRAGYADYEADEVWHRRTARTRLKRIARAVGSGDGVRLLDIGTATGFLCDEAKRRNWDASAVELSDWAAARARARGVRVARDASAYAGEEPFDAISFFQVLEHMPQPADALAEAYALLQPGGVVVCETWDVASRTARFAGRGWQQMSPPSVLWLFTRPGIEAWANRAGLEMRSWKVSPKVVSLATVAGQSLPDSGRLGRTLRSVGTKVGLPYPLDDLITFVLVKPQ